MNTQPIPASDLGVTTQMNLLSALDEEQAQKDAMKGDADEIEAIAYASSEDVENRNKLVRSFFDKVCSPCFSIDNCSHLSPNKPSPYHLDKFFFIAYCESRFETVSRSLNMSMLWGKLMTSSTKKCFHHFSPLVLATFPLMICWPLNDV